MRLNDPQIWPFTANLFLAPGMTSVYTHWLCWKGDPFGVSIKEWRGNRRAGTHWRLMKKDFNWSSTCQKCKHVHFHVDQTTLHQQGIKTKLNQELKSFLCYFKLHGVLIISILRWINSLHLLYTNFLEIYVVISPLILNPGFILHNYIISSFHHGIIYFKTLWSLPRVYVRRNTQ